MKHTLKDFTARLLIPKSFNIGRYLQEWKKELQQLKQEWNIYCNNCKDLSGKNLLNDFLGENQQ